MKWLRSLPFNFIVFTLLLGVIVSKLQTESLNLQCIYNVFSSSKSIALVGLAIVLMPLNWLLESWKWKLMLSKKNVSFLDSVKSVLSGVTTGIISPFRSGEFIGRTSMLEDISGPHVFYKSSWTGLAQVIATLIMASVFIVFYNQYFFAQGILTGIAIVLLLFYFTPDFFSDLLLKINIVNSHNLVPEKSEIADKNKLTSILLLSLLRLTVFSFQYVLIFKAMGVQYSVLYLFSSVILMMVAHTFSPLLPFFDIIWKGSVALMIFDNSLIQAEVLSSVFVIWVLNQIIPALIGYIILIDFKKEN